MSVNNALVEYEFARRLAAGYLSGDVRIEGVPPANASDESARFVAKYYPRYMAGVFESVLWKDLPVYACESLVVNSVRDSSDGIPDDMKFGAVLPPAAHGFLYFNEPVPVVWGGVGERLRWILWMPTAEPPEGTRWDDEITGPLTPDTDVSGVLFALGVTDHRGEWPNEAYPRNFIQWFRRWSIGEVEPIIPDADWTPGNSWRQHIEIVKLCVGLWAFMQQKIAAPRKEHPSRPVARGYIRRTGTEPPELHVVKLRAYESRIYETAQSLGREWTHSWVVRGHWRNQWYPKRNMHSPVWIAPYVKGDGPLIGARKVFEVAR